MNKPNRLSMEIAQCLQLLFCLIVIKLLLVKSRCKFAVLSLKNFYLRFRYRKLVNRQRQTLAEYVAHRNGFQGSSGSFDKAQNCPLEVDFPLAANVNVHQVAANNLNSKTPVAPPLWCNILFKKAASAAEV